MMKTYFFRLIIICSLPLLVFAMVLVALISRITPLHGEMMVYAYDDGFVTQSIRLVDIRRGYQHTLADFNGTDFYPAWSPDGEQIVFSSILAGVGMDLYTISPTGHTLTRMTENQNAKFQVQWSPDSTYIAWMEYGPTMQAVFVQDVTTRQIRQISDWWETRLEGFAWSPDSQYISILADPTSSDTPTARLYILPVDDGGAARLLYDELPVMDASWSPDGERIAFIAGNTVAGQGRVYIVDVNSGAVRAVDDQLRARRVAWSPDGETLALSAYLSATFRLLLYDVTTDTRIESLSGQRVLSASPLVWSPDGHLLAFAYGRNLFILNVENGSIRKLSDNFHVGSTVGRFMFRP